MSLLNPIDILKEEVERVTNITHFKATNKPK